MPLHSIDLNSRFRLYAFATYRDMAAAKTQLRSVVLFKELSKVREIEAKYYVRDLGTGYKNYLRNDTADLKQTALASLVTALQALYKVNGYSAKYIAVERLL